LPGRRARRARTSLDASGVRGGRALGPRCAGRTGPARDGSRRAAGRPGPRVSAARCPLRTEPPEAGQRARPDRARGVGGAALGLRLDARRAVPFRPPRLRVEDAAPEPSPRQHLRLQRRRRPRREPHPVRPRYRGRRGCRRAGPGRARPPRGAAAGGRAAGRAREHRRRALPRRGHRHRRPSLRERGSGADGGARAARPDGTLEVRDLRRAAVYSRCGELEDAGDVGDEYTFSPPVSDRLVTSAEARLPVVRRIEPGPLRATLRIDLELPVPSAATDDRCGRRDDTVMLPVSIRVSLEAGSPRVEWTMTVDNAARDHRLRVLFPTAAATVTSARAATAFGVVDRPARPSPPPPGALEDPVGTAPLQGFVDARDGQAGVFVLPAGRA